MTIRRERTILGSDSCGLDSAEPTGVRAHDFWTNQLLCVADVLRDSGKCYPAGLFEDQTTQCCNACTCLDSVDIHDAVQTFMTQFKLLSLGLSIWSFRQKHKALIMFFIYLFFEQPPTRNFVHSLYINLLFKYNWAGCLLSFWTNLLLKN